MANGFSVEEHLKNLTSKHRLLRFNSRCTDADIKAADVVIQYLGEDATYHRSNYRVIKRPADMSDEDVAIMCDVCAYYFGYRCSGDRIQIYTD